MSVRIAVISGSVRNGSHNSALAALAAARIAAAGGEAEVIDLATYNLPVYSQDLELQDCPPDARRLKAVLAGSDGVLIATPEHNGSISTLLKNAIDWASRPGEGETLVTLSAFRGKTAGIMAASIGPFGGMRALAHLRQILGTVQMMVVPEQLAVPFADRAFTAERALAEPLPNMILDGLVARVLEVAERLRP
ncbi:NADPH-dependent FMN reductase [uncultured Sphingomonas sp.]|uniref:NADPH-dependent FMN reductase n=1 Tax=uncultured Sphingomonas sp. TaxID=158754 RepID=UPI002606FFE9|nr:NAD(P)H-dependent oxidoreductase [uncultured Sphingomonas sp.]